jgi:hypothetical protein
MMLTTQPNLGSKVKERVDLYFSSWPSWPALELIFSHVWAHFMFFSEKLRKDSDLLQYETHTNW